MTKFSLLTAARIIIAYWGLSIVSGISLQNPLGLAVLLGLVFLDRERGKIEDPRALSPWIRTAGALFALMSVAATNRYFTAAYSSHLFKLGYIFIAAAGLLVFWDTLLPVVSERALRLSDNGILLVQGASHDGSDDKPKGTGRSGLKRTLLAVVGFLIEHPALLCLLCWLPYYLYEYPGIISPDGIVQIEQVLGKTPLSDHHPVAHTALIALFMRIGSLFTDDITYQVSFYTAAQMIFLSLSCRAVVKTLRQLGLRPAFTSLTTIFFALMPYNGVFSVFILKDVPFSGVTALFTCSIMEICVRKDIKPGLILRFAIWGLALCVLRSNGIIAFAAGLPFMLFAWRRRASFKKLLIACAAVLTLAIIYKGPVLGAMGAERPDLAESLSLPLQQVARVLVDDKRIEDEDREMIERVIDTTWIRQIYAPDYADNVKELLRAGDQDYLSAHKGEYFMLWLRLGIRHPGVYLQAFSEHTKGLWYPDEGIDVARIDGVCPNDLGIESRPLIVGRAVVKLKELLIKSGALLPGLSMLWSMGFFFWVLIYLTALTGAQGRFKERLSIFLPSLALYLTLIIATPNARTFRFSYPFVICFALYIAATEIRPEETESM